MDVRTTVTIQHILVQSPEYYDSLIVWNFFSAPYGRDVNFSTLLFAESYSFSEFHPVDGGKKEEKKVAPPVFAA